MYIKLRLLPLLVVAWILFGSLQQVELLAIFYFILYFSFWGIEWEVFLIFALYFHIAVVIIFKNMIEKLEHLGWKLHMFESNNLLAFGAEELSRPIHLYLIFEKSSLKNQVRRTGFLTCKNPFWNRFLQATQAVKIQFEIN